MLCVQTAVEDLLQAFENATHNNNPVTDPADAATDYHLHQHYHPATVDDVTAAEAAAVVAGENVVVNPLPSAGVNQTQNNDAITDNDRTDKKTGNDDRRLRRASATSLVSQAAGGAWRGGEGGRGGVMRAVSQTSARRGRSSSLVVDDAQRCAKKTASSASLGVGPAAQHPRRSSSTSLRHEQQQPQPQPQGRYRLSRQTSRDRQLIDVPRRRSTVPLAVDLTF